MSDKKQKTTLIGLGLKKLHVDTVEVEFNGAIFEVDTYIPVPKKFAIINDAIGLSYINGIFNPLAIEASFHALLVQQVTNIGFSKGQQQNLIDTYDLLNSSGLLEKVCDALGDTYDEIVEDLVNILGKLENTQKTFAEQLTDLIKSVKDILMEMENLTEDDFSLIKDVVAKMEVQKQ